MRIKFICSISASCAALLLTACGGDGASETAAVESPSSLCAPERLQLSSLEVATAQQTPKTLEKIDTFVKNCYANSSLKSLIESDGAAKLVEHLKKFGAAGDKLHDDATQGFLKLIENSRFDSAPTQQDFMDFVARLRKLPAFSSLTEAGALNFALLGLQREKNEFLEKLTETFELQPFYAKALALQERVKASLAESNHWPIVRPSTASEPPAAAAGAS